MKDKSNKTIKTNNIDKSIDKTNYTFSMAMWKLHTGRTHQIRVHSEHIGMPILGDDTYGGSSSRHNNQTTTKKSGSKKKSCNSVFDMIDRPALHAKTLGFIHPKTGEEMLFEAEIPDDMQRVIKFLSDNSSNN